MTCIVVRGPARVTKYLEKQGGNDWYKRILNNKDMKKAKKEKKKRKRERKKTWLTAFLGKAHQELSPMRGSNLGRKSVHCCVSNTEMVLNRIKLTPQP